MMSGITSRSGWSLTQLWQRQRQLKVRRVVFLIHLWTGVALALWVILIGLSGSVLVFEDNLSRVLLPAATLPPSSEQVPMALVLQSARRANPKAVPYYITTPDAAVPFFRVWLHDGAREQVFTADARTGQLLPPAHPGWTRALAAVHDFHVYLLLGATGLRINAVLSAALFLGLCTGVVLWWPGIRSRRWVLRVNLRHGWKRINFDLHHAVGFWALLWCLCWAVSGFYFGFPTALQRVVGSLFSLKAMQAPQPRADTGAFNRPTLGTVLAKAQQQSPGAFLSGVSLPGSEGSPYIVTLDTRAPGDFSHRDIVQIGARSGEVLSVWHYGQNRTAADSVLWALYGLHFGTLWGEGWKTIWALVGISLPLLAITGCLMYWNRFLSKVLR